VNYRKAYGLADLELGVPLSPQCVFDMAPVSKQFTAASVVLAAERGYLSLDDDVRKYIPELPDYGHVITLRQMIHQNSGLRDFLTLLLLSGNDRADFNFARRHFQNCGSSNRAEQHPRRRVDLQQHELPSARYGH